MQKPTGYYRDQYGIHPVFRTLDGRLTIVPENYIGSEEPRDTYTHGGECIRMVGTSSDYIISLQDGSGRIQHYWNAMPGSGSGVFLVGGENAGKWEFNPVTPEDDLFSVHFADGSAADAGDPITWTDILRVGTNGLYLDAGNLYVEAGVIEAQPDTDTIHKFGRAYAGYSGHADHAAFGHIDSTGATNYALLQSAGGATYLNAASGQNLRFRINNSTKAYIGSDGYFRPGANGYPYIKQNTGLRIQTEHGNVTIGPINSGWCHFSTDRGQFYFGDKVHVNGEIKVYSHHVYLDSSGLHIDDNDRLYVGIGEDLQLWHSGSHSYIDNYTGHIYIRQRKHGYCIYFQGEDAGGTNKAMLYMDPDSWVRLYYHGSLRFETTSAGAKVTGDLEVTGEISNSAVVPQAALKTSQGSVSCSANTSFTNLTLPGGEFGFYPRVKCEHSSYPVFANICNNISGYEGTSYATIISLKSDQISSSYDIFAQQRYVTSSGEIYWIFILQDKDTKERIAVWQAPDHPCFGNGGDPEALPHPFLFFDEAKHEIIVINPTKEQVANINNGLKRPDGMRDASKDFIEILFEKYEIDEMSTPEWPTRAITVGLPMEAEPIPGEKVTPIKKTIPDFRTKYAPGVVRLKSLKVKQHERQII